jgi:glutamyl-tRNA reductase
MGPVVMQVQGQIEDICKSELDRYTKKTTLDPKQLQDLEQMISRIAGKIAHPLVMQLRSSPDSSNPSTYADLVKRIFKMKDSE